MQPSIASDVFFILGSVFLVTILIVLIFIIVYAIRIARVLRGVRGTVSKAKAGTLLLSSGLFGKGMLATAIIRRVLSFWKSRRARKR